MMIRFVFKCFFYISASILILTSCSQTDNTIGQDLVSSNLRQVVIDTCTVRMSTAFFDSTLTSGKNTILTGFYNDNVFGPTTAVSYVSFTSPSSSVTNPLTAIFDSVCLRIKHNKYYRGDTLQFQNLDIYPLSEKVVLYNDGYLYNTTAFQMYEDPIGSKYFRPKTGSSGPVYIRLNDNFGQRFFTKICGGSDTIFSSDQFVNYFKGLAIVPGKLSQSVFGFAADTSMYIRFYYHQLNDALNTLTLDVPSNNTLQYNHIIQDRSKTLLAPFNKNNPQISSSETNHQVFMQPINSFYPVVEFPYVSELLKLGNYGSIVKAVIELYPVQGTYSLANPLPSGLSLYITDYLNAPLGALSSGTNTQDGKLNIDNVYDLNTKYTFDITSFLKAEITSIGVYKRKIQIALPSTEAGNKLSSLVIGDQQHPKNQIKLKITYAIYDAK